MIGYLLRRAADVPAGDGWLSEAERAWYGERRSAKRVADWRLGRWTAKSAAAAFLSLRGRPAPPGLEVLAAADGAPELRAAGRRLELSLSLSHSHGRALAVVAAAGSALGCDLERIEPRSAAFIAAYLTEAERAALAAEEETARPLLVNLSWSAKESALKALRHGLRADTRSVEVRVTAPAAYDWGWLEVARPAGEAPLAGRWRRFDDLVATIAGRPAPRDLRDLDEPNGG